MNTQVLVVTNSLDATADYLCSQMIGASVPFLRFNSDVNLNAILIEYGNGHPTLTIGDACISPEQVSSVWLRRPESLKIMCEAQSETERKHLLEEWTAAIEGFLCTSLARGG